MAFTNTVQYKTVYGNHRIHSFMVTADGAEGTCVTGLETVLGIVGLIPYSMTTAAIKIKRNTLTSGTAAAGTIALTACTNGDQFTLVVAGK